jgi:multiple sugar transport system permease protein
MAFILLAPAVLSLVVLTIYPLLHGLYLSLTDYQLVSSKATSFVGLRNYTDLFADPEFWNAVSISLRFTFFAVLSEMILGVALALLLAQPLRGVTIARTVIIAGMVLTPVIVGTAWRLMYNPGWGLISYFLSFFGIRDQAFLASARTVLPALIIVDVWQWTPLVMLIALAGLQGISPEYYEAAEVDGAGAFQRFRHVTLPLLKPSLAVALLIRTMDCFRTFDVIYAMTGGGPGTSSQNLMVFAYYTGFEFFRISAASAIAFVSLVLITLISMVIVRSFGVSLWRKQI